MCVERFYTVFFGTALFIEVLCGLIASITAAYFSGGQANTWGIIIFAVYSIFSVGIIYFVIKEVRTLEKRTGEPASETLNWLFGLCAVVTLTILGLIYWLAWPQSEKAKAFIIGPGIIVFLLMFLLLYVWVCFRKLFYFKGQRLDKEKATCGECYTASCQACGSCCDMLCDVF